MRCIVAILLILTCADLARGGVIVLRDGTRIEGEVRKAGGGWAITRADGSLAVVASSEVAAIEMSSRPAGSDAGDPAAATAAPSTDQESRIAQIDQARRLLKDARIGEAEELIQQVLRSDSSNISAQYLAGLLAFRAGRIPSARRSFQAVVDAIPDHAPALNNLAVVMWRQNHHAAAMLYYDRAMQAAPIDRDILDNISVAVASLPESSRDAPAVRRALERFDQQDEALRLQMKQAGLQRVDGRWVPLDSDAADQGDSADSAAGQRLIGVDGTPLVVE